MKAMKNYTILAVILAITVLGSGCNMAIVQVKHEPSSKHKFGDTVRRAAAVQKLNPGAGTTDPVTGADGEYVAGVMNKYRKTPEDGGGKTLFEEALGQMLGGGKK